MAKYRVIEGFYDLQDPEGRSCHLYSRGDVYPREGLEPTQERIAFLLSASNRLSRPVIEEVPETLQEPAEGGAQKAVESPAEETAEPSEGPQKAPKRRRK